jgi:hypothetical protein
LFGLGQSQAQSGGALPRAGLELVPEVHDGDQPTLHRFEHNLPSTCAAEIARCVCHRSRC